MRLSRKTDLPKANNYIITSIETQSHKADRVSVFIDGSFFCGLSAAAAARLKLKKGQVLSDQQLMELQEAHDTDKAIQFTLRSLARTSQPSPRLREKLQIKGFSEAITNQTITYLLESGYLNDDSYIRRFIADAVHLKKWGKGRIQIELRKRGFQPDAFEQYLPSDNETNLETIREQVKRRFGPKPPPGKAERFLLYRGHSWDVIRKVLNPQEPE